MLTNAQAQSPDEKALVEAARDVGFVFEGRVGEKMNISINGNKESYLILNILAFNSTRKRMSVSHILSLVNLS